MPRWAAKTALFDPGTASHLGNTPEKGALYGVREQQRHESAVLANLGHLGNARNMLGEFLRPTARWFHEAGGEIGACEDPQIW